MFKYEGFSLEFGACDRTANNSSSGTLATQRQPQEALQLVHAVADINTEFTMPEGHKSHVSGPIRHPNC